MSIRELVESVIAHAGRTIFGPSVSAEGRTVVPLAKVSYGFGMGSGPAREGAPEKEGGGGGLRGQPTGYIEITAEGTRYVRILDYREIAAAFAAGLLAGYLWGRLAGQQDPEAGPRD